MYRSTSPSPYAPHAQPPRSHSPAPPINRAYSPQPYAQPYPPQQPQPYMPPVNPVSPASGQQVVEGSVTYTTSVGPDGRTLYHPFKAVAASYQTPNGVVSGIQWVPAEATHVLPQGAQPASAEFTSSWNRGYAKDSDKLKEWQREEEKRRKREEKESKRLREQQEYRNEAEKYERERRKSFNAGPPAPGFVPFPPEAAGGRPTSPYHQPYADLTSPPYGAPQPPAGTNPYGRERKHSNVGYDSLGRQFDDMKIASVQVEAPKSGGAGRPRKYSTSTGDERPGPYASPYGPAPPTGASPYGSPYAPPAAPGYAASGGKYSPNPARPGELPFIPPGAGGNPTYPGSTYSSNARGPDPSARATAPYGAAISAGQPEVYPRGHVMEGQPIPPRSRASSPMPGPPPGPAPYGQPYPGQHARTHSSHSPRPPASPHLPAASPHMHGGVLPDAAQQLPPPDGFIRPVNPSLSFAPFEITKVQTMEDLLIKPSPPRMPGFLRAHDVYSEDWMRLMNDLRLAWSGRLPVPTDSRSGQPPRRTTLVADLVDLWNTSFFLARGVELVLYKGRERRSGPRAGTIDNLPLDDDDSEESESEDEDDDDESDLEEYLARNANAYGRPQDFDPVIIARRRREAREEKRRARKEKEAKRKAKAKEKEKAYAVYLTYSPISGALHTTGGMPGGYTPVATTTYVPAQPVGGYGRHGGY